MRLAIHATDDELLGFVEAWIDDLVRGDYEAAFARTRHDPYYQWTPALMKAVVNGYGMPDPDAETIYVVTPRAVARGRPHYRKVDRETVPPPAIAEVFHDLPLNGEWSDLTVTFRVEQEGDALALILQEIHVF